MNTNIWHINELKNATTKRYLDLAEISTIFKSWGKRGMVPSLYDGMIAALQAKSYRRVKESVLALRAIGR